MSNYYCYMVECNDGRIYTGMCNNLERRVSEHNFGCDPAAFTFNRRPVKLIWSENFQDPNDAIAAEKKLKGWRKSKKLALASGEIEKLPILASSSPEIRSSFDKLRMTEDANINHGHAEPMTSGHAGPMTSGHAGPMTSGHAGPMTSGHAEPMTSGHAGPMTSGHAEPMTSGHAEPVEAPPANAASHTLRQAQGDMAVVSPALRPASTVMRLARMGQSFPHKLSFSRQIIRRMLADNSAVTRPVWDMDDQGHGRAVYSVTVGGHTYSLVAICAHLDDSMRSDRVIAEAWDACFTLFDGVPTQQDLDRLADNQPKQEAGRYSARELTLSRANKSVRLFTYVRDCLARGEQPEVKPLNDIGYLMRTTAVYGNGKFGIADRHDYAGRGGMSAPFQAEMLTVWLIRGFTHDVVEHCAKAINPNAVALDLALKRHLGVGNSTGLGMAPFLVHHPELLDHWVLAREQALAAVLHADEPVAPNLIDRAQRHLNQWNVADDDGQSNIECSVREMKDLPHASAQHVFDWSQTKSLSTQELVVALLLENTSLDLSSYAAQMSFEGPPGLSLDSHASLLRERIDSKYDWALNDNSDEHWFWYVSENKLEPRVGERATQEGAALERPLTIVRNIKALRLALEEFEGDCGAFLAQQPQFASTIRRLGASGRYGEIQDNLTGKAMRPIDMLRFKLSFFGASKFDPKSSLWTRIALFQGAPTRENLHDPGDDWWLSAL